jgi:hypothetical protein
VNGLKHKTILAILTLQKISDALRVIRPLRGTQVPIMIRRDHHFADGRFELIRQ